MIIKIVIVLILSISLEFLWPQSARGDDGDISDSLLIDFEIEDQFKAKHTDEEFRGSVILFLSGDRKGNEYAKIWEQELRDSLGELIDYNNVSFIRAANLKGVPFFIKGKVRGSFSKEPDRWVLTDWKNRFAKAYDFRKDAANILLFDREGKLRKKIDVEEIKYEIMNDILRETRALVSDKQLE